MEEKRHTSLHYENELQEIKNDLIYMGALTEKAIQQMMTSLSERNSNMARKVIKDDDEIDRLDTELEERCIKLLALRQPTAIDLRFITTAIKITGHLGESAPSRHPIPVHVGTLIRNMPAGDSGASRQVLVI
jgi:phosphate transport system protein